MSRRTLGIFAAFPHAVTLMALLFVLWYHELNWNDRVWLVDTWTWIAGFAAVMFVAHMMWKMATGGSPHAAYGRVMPVSSDFQSDTEISLVKIPTLVFTITGGSVMALGFIVLGQRMFSGQPIGLISFPTLWLCLGLGFLLATIRYSSSLSTIGPRLIYRYGFLGLSFRRIKTLGTSLAIRLRTEIYIENRKGGSTREEDVTLDLLDGSTIHVLNYDACPAAAERVSSLLGISSFEEFVLHYSDKIDPPDLPRLAQAPQIPWNRNLPAGLLVMTLVAASIPWMFKGALVLEQDPAVQTMGARLESHFDPLNFLLADAPPRSSAARTYVGISSPEAYEAFGLERKHGEDNRHPDQQARADYEQALEIWKRLLDQDPNNPDNAYFILSRGRLRIRLGQIKEGLEDLETFRKAHPKHWRSTGYDGRCPLPESLLAMTYWQVGDFDRALFFIEKQVHTSDEAVYGLVLTEFERWEEAERCLKEAERRAEQDVRWIDAEALALLQKRLASRRNTPALNKPSAHR